MSGIIFNTDNKKGGFLKYIIPFSKKKRYMDLILKIK